MIVIRDSKKEDAREVKSLVVNVYVVHLSITRRLASNLQMKLKSSVLFFFYFYLKHYVVETFSFMLVG